MPHWAGRKAFLEGDVILGVNYWVTNWDMKRNSKAWPSTLGRVSSSFSLGLVLLRLDYEIIESDMLVNAEKLALQEKMSWFIPFVMVLIFLLWLISSYQSDITKHRVVERCTHSSPESWELALVHQGIQDSYGIYSGLLLRCGCQAGSVFVEGNAWKVRHIACIKPFHLVA